MGIKAMELINLYDRGIMDINMSGIYEDVYTSGLDMEKHYKHMFGQDFELLFGELEERKNYVYVYSKDFEDDAGFENIEPAMMLSNDDGIDITFYEIV